MVDQMRFTPFASTERTTSLSAVNAEAPTHPLKTLLIAIHARAWEFEPHDKNAIPSGGACTRATGSNCRMCANCAPSWQGYRLKRTNTARHAAVVHYRLSNNCSDAQLSGYKSNRIS